MTDQLPVWAAWASIIFTVLLVLALILSIPVIIWHENHGRRLPARMRVPLGSDDPTLAEQETTWQQTHPTMNNLTD